MGLAVHQSEEASLLRDPCLVSDVFCINSVDIDSIECIKDPCLVLTVLTYIVLMVWLKSLQSQLSKTFCGLKIG